MNPNDFVFNSVFTGAISAGATEIVAKRHAEDALQIYKESRMGGKVTDLIKKSIAAAKKECRKKSGGCEAMKLIVKLRKMYVKEEDFDKVADWAYENIKPIKNQVKWLSEHAGINKATAKEQVTIVALELTTDNITRF